MYRDHTVGVVIPAYNEEGFVGDVIREVPEYVDRLYVVDDRSTDGTWEEVLEAAALDADRAAETDASEATSVADSLAADGGATALHERATVHDRVGRVVPIQHTENRGAGGAIKTGYLAALAEGVDATATIDADGQMDLEHLPRLLDPIVEDTADYTKGNRLLNSEYRAAMPRFRLFGNAILTLLTKVASGYWKTMDPQNGYTVISNDALEAVDLPELYEYYGYCNDLLVKLNASEMRVADVAMPAVYGDEESSIAYHDYIPKVSMMLLRNFWWRLRTKYLVRDFHPLALFYVLGSATAAIGMAGLLGALVAARDRADGTSSLLVAVTGAALVLFAMVFDMRESEHLENQLE